jgi:hypothetical protein
MARNGIDFNSILDRKRERNASEMPSDVLDLSPGPASPKTAKSRGVHRKKSASCRPFSAPSANLIQKF